MVTKKILVVTEGERQEFRLVQRLKDVYLPQEIVEIVPYRNNIYNLYKKLSDYCDDDFSSLDFVNVLLETEQDFEKKQLLSQKFTDILLIFDFERQADNFDFGKLKKLMEFFRESTENGRLYINYPMFESFFHLANIKEAVPDTNFKQRNYSLPQIKAGQYKTIARSAEEGCSLNAEDLTKKQLDCVINQQLCKANYILSGEYASEFNLNQNNMLEIMKKEYAMLGEYGTAPVLNTCSFYIVEEYPHSIR